MLRIIDKQTKLFIRDDFDFDEETEIGLNVTPSQGLHKPRWDGTQWIETGQAPEPTPQEPTIAERLEQTEELLRNGLNDILQAIENIKNPPELDESLVIDE